MAYNRAKDPVYVKGTMDVWCHNPQTGDLDYFSNKIQTNQLTTSVNMGAINAGVGNPVVINIPDTAQVNLTITAADMSLEARALSVGGKLSYNGITPIMESVTATGTSLTVTNTPCAPYGVNRIFCFIDQSGTAYEIDPSTKTVQGFTATSGTSYCVRYFTQQASAQQLTVGANFAPNVETVMIRLPAYSAQGSSANYGSLVGHYYIWIPRMQFSGSAATEGSQTTPATTDLSGSALSYQEAVQQGVCPDSVQASLAYMVYMPMAGATASVEGLVVIGGSITVGIGDSMQLPVKYVIDGQLVQPDYADLSYQSSADGTATVSQTGLVEGVAAGDAEITVTLASPSLKCVCNVEVTA